MDGNIAWQMEKRSLSERFKELHKLSQWTDCVFSVGETKIEQIKSHKLLLATSSPVFEALFYGPMAEFNDSVIRITDLEPETFRQLLEYLYCDKVVVSDIYDAGMLLYASKKYLLPHLSRFCIEYIIQHIQLSNLQDVLVFAESLHEEKLLDTCLRIMGQYSVNLWTSSCQHLTRSTLCLLLDQDASNSTESELWNFVISWAKEECKLKGMDPSPENMRLLIDELGLLQRIRFLTFSSSELVDFVKPTCVISDSELVVLNDCIKFIESGSSCKHSYRCNNNNVEDKHCMNCGANRENIDFIVPEGFSSNINNRIRISKLNNYCPRQIVTKRKTWTFGGTFCTNITPINLVLVTGFELFTRIPSPADFCMSHGRTDQYTERLVIRICDDRGIELSKTNYSGVADFNAAQSVKLVLPIWFHPNRKYSVSFELADGQYPLSQMSATAGNMITGFRFEECYSNENQDKYFGFSLLSAVMFSF